MVIVLADQSARGLPIFEKHGQHFIDACAIVAPLNARIVRNREIADTRDQEGYGYVATFDPGAPTTLTIPGDAIPYGRDACPFW